MKNKSKLGGFFKALKIATKKNYLPNKKGGTILKKGILITCLILSFASGLIDLVFFSGLSKSIFHLSTIPMHAALLYTVISTGMISGKFFCATYIGMLRELRVRLKADGISWYKNINKALLPWHGIHKFLVTVSIITALSMSFNSVGEGIRRIEQTISNMTYDANNLISLDQSLKTSSRDKSAAAKGNITATKNAQAEALAEFEREWETVEACRAELAQLDETAEDYNAQSEAIRKRYSNKVALNGITWKNIGYAQKSTIKNQILAANKEFEVVDETSYIEESINFDKNAVEETLLALVDKNYKYPDGEVISFVNEDGSLVNIQLAISRLQQGIAAWQADTGDVGESSKIFTMVATYIKASPKAGGMGVSEWLLVIFIAFVGIAQEFLIAKFTPKAHIDRDILGMVSDYLEWENDEQEERFLMRVYKKYEKDGILSKEEAEARYRECVENMEKTEEDIIERYSKKRKIKDNKIKASDFEKLKYENEELNAYIKKQSESYKERINEANQTVAQKELEIVNLRNEMESLKKPEPKEDNSALLNALNKAESVLAEKDE